MSVIVFCFVFLILYFIAKKDARSQSERIVSALFSLLSACFISLSLKGIDGIGVESAILNLFEMMR